MSFAAAAVSVTCAGSAARVAVAALAAFAGGGAAPIKVKAPQGS
jgi:hypothetical protein